MHFTLHLTDACNLSCRYCYVQPNTNFMSEKVARATVDLATTYGGSNGLIFFGGEPLLCRDRIYDTVDYAKKMQDSGKTFFHYKITTNGTLLDEEFMRFSAANNVFIALSHDGVKAAHDANRIREDGTGTFNELEDKAKLLLAYRPYAPVMMTVAPNTVSHYADGIEYLYGLGFRYLICSLDYAGKWTPKLLGELERQYKRLAVWYKDLTIAENKFFFSPFETKISSWINKTNYRAERCELGLKQISVAPDGKLYPCVQFVNEQEYVIGDVFSGIDEERRQELYRLNETEREPCIECSVKNRCNHWCACLNKQATGDFRSISPLMCAHERLIIPIADRLAEDLYKKRSAMFIQKQYNDMYPLISSVEDKIYDK